LHNVLFTTEGVNRARQVTILVPGRSSPAANAGSTASGIGIFIRRARVRRVWNMMVTAWEWVWPATLFNNSSCMIVTPGLSGPTTSTAKSTAGTAEGHVSRGERKIFLQDNATPVGHCFDCTKGPARTASRLITNYFHGSTFRPVGGRVKFGWKGLDWNFELGLAFKFRTTGKNSEHAFNLDL
jgi:hypothetical protein